MNSNIIISVFTAGVLLVIGLLMTSGFIFRQASQSNRIVFGIVLTAFGIFRMITIYTKIKQQKLDERRERMQAEKEKLLRKS